MKQKRIKSYSTKNYSIRNTPAKTLIRFWIYQLKSIRKMTWQTHIKQILFKIAKIFLKIGIHINILLIVWSCKQCRNNVVTQFQLQPAKSKNVEIWKFELSINFLFWIRQNMYFRKVLAVKNWIVALQYLEFLQLILINLLLL